jgi:hypothetical protein
MSNKKISIKNAKIMYRNFAGKEGKFNPKGRRVFCVLLDDETADMLKKDGYNIRWAEPRDPEDKKQAYMSVRVSFSNVNIPPKIVLITSENKTVLTEDTVGILDLADIESIDMILNPYNWKVGSGTGVTPYVKSMYITIAEDEFEAKYRDVPNRLPESIDATPPWD